MITAVGIADVLWVMIVAVLIAAGVMLTFAGAISAFVERHPTMKILALAFLILIGSMLVIEGWNPEAAHELHLKNYAYFAMAFSFIIELINLRLRKQSATPVNLHNQPNLAQAAPMPAMVGAGVTSDRSTSAARPNAPRAKSKRKKR